jgi:hypothetical protein
MNIIQNTYYKQVMYHHDNSPNFKNRSTKYKNLF